MSQANTDYKFLDYHKPILEDGEYNVTVSQTIAVHDYSSTPTTPSIPPKTLTFHVDGPKFDLDPSLVQAVYPPKGGKGDYMSAMPTLTLNRSTLPWERLPGTTKIAGNSASWLFLLLVDETENSKVTENNNIPLSTVGSTFFGSTPSTDKLSRYPSKINYLTLDSTMTAIFPKLGDLEYLSYARLNDTDENDEKAVLLCNRLPQQGHNSTVYLVSLEGAYTGANDPNGNPTFSGLKIGTNVVMPYLYKWQFHAFSDQLFEITENTNLPVGTPSLVDMFDHVYTTKESFETALKNAGITDTTKYPGIEAVSKLKGANFVDVLSHMKGGFGPLCLSKQTGVLSTGSTELPYYKSKYVSSVADAYYRGPLVATNLTPINSQFPLHTDGSVPLSPESLFLTNGSKEEDTSYASAFELGKLTALADSDFCNEFYKWKSEKASYKRLKKFSETKGYKNIFHLPLSDLPADVEIPTHVKDKFEDWKNLKGIPFRYLVPDMEMLPNESIRFFQIDNAWINSFIAGAFSIGKTVEADLSTDLSGLFLPSNAQFTGFIINSIMVNAWPEYEVDVYNVIHNPVPSQPLPGLLPVTPRFDLDVNVQMYLFSGQIKQLIFRLHAAKKHNGFLYTGGQYKKEGHAVTINANNTFDISALKTAIGATTTIAEFGVNMMEKSKVVTFNIS